MMINRLKEAAEYQKKAIRALFPERVLKHIDVIGNEIKLMVAECMETEEKKPEKKAKTGKIEIS
ncbi:MAG: hypothetical protein K5686_07740 [Lachnospiraceae bacterium]|nr:hypothetical protein [Lachnospiraceae bacterium]